jgi:DNA-binding transcriptional ArsR family regulator
VREFDYVIAAELDAAALHFAISPLPTAFTLTRDALQGGRRGTSRAWRQAVLSGLRTRDVQAFAPLTDRSTTGWPTLLDDVHAESETLDEALERVAQTPGSAVVEALENDRDVTPTPAWDVVRREPERWLAGYVDAVHRGWRGLEPLWRRASSLLEREAERVQAAVERGVPTSQIANGLLPRTSLVDGTLRMTTSEPRRLSVDPKGLTVTPMIAASSASSLVSPGDALVRAVYPLREYWRAFEDDAPPPASLQALLGAQRTALIKLLDFPQPAGQLARALNLSPSAMTFQLRTLEAAGLISRERLGRNIMVHRTPRGTQLLALYALP